jgi:tryptophan synthase beta chain
MNAAFCKELVKQEMDADTRLVKIPEELLEFYKSTRPSPLIRARFLEKELDTPAEIYYKFEGNNTSGSHKFNSAAAQVYYAKEEGLENLTTETGAGQWGTALAMACAFFKINLTVYMVKISSQQKPYRKRSLKPSARTSFRLRRKRPRSAGASSLKIQTRADRSAAPFRRRWKRL